MRKCSVQRWVFSCQCVLEGSLCNPEVHYSGWRGEVQRRICTVCVSVHSAYSPIFSELTLNPIKIPKQQQQKKRKRHIYPMNKCCLCSQSLTQCIPSCHKAPFVWQLKAHQWATAPHQVKSSLSTLKNMLCESILHTLSCRQCNYCSTKRALICGRK